MDPEVLEKLNQILSSQELKAKQDNVTKRHIESNITKISQEIKHEKQLASNRICPDLMREVVTTMKSVCKMNMRSVSNDFKMINILKQQLSERQKQLDDLQHNYNYQLEQSREKLANIRTRSVSAPTNAVGKAMQELKDAQAILKEEKRVSAELKNMKRAKENAEKSAEQAAMIEFARLYIVRMAIEKNKLLQQTNKMLEQDEWRLLKEVQKIDNEKFKTATQKLKIIAQTPLSATLKPTEYYLNLLKTCPPKVSNQSNSSFISNERLKFNKSNFETRKRRLTPDTLQFSGSSSLHKIAALEKSVKSPLQSKQLKTLQSQITNDYQNVEILEQTIFSAPKQSNTMAHQCVSRINKTVQIEKMNSTLFDESNFLNVPTDFNADQPHFDDTNIFLNTFANEPPMLSTFSKENDTSNNLSSVKSDGIFSPNILSKRDFYPANFNLFLENDFFSFMN